MRRQRVLVIEDDKTIADEYVEALDDHGAEVMTAVSRIEALQLLRLFSFDGAIVDLQLSDDLGFHQGIEILDEINRMQEGVRTIVVTGTENAFDVNQAHGQKPDFGVVLKGLKLEDGSNFSYYKVAEKFVKSLPRSTISDSLKMDFLNYLSGPESRSEWDVLLSQKLKVNVRNLTEALVSGLLKYGPLIKEVGEDKAFGHTENGVAHSYFWSKSEGFAIEVLIYLDRDDERIELRDANFSQVFGNQVRLEVGRAKGKHRSEFRDFIWS